MRHRLLGLVVAVVGLAAPQRADAFCGFYVEGSGKKLFADATQVVLMREGTRTVLAMQNDYKGPPDAFAMVIPVPVVLQEADVKTLEKDVFARVEQMSAPRLVEYWEADPCKPYSIDADKMVLEAAGGAAPKDAKVDSGEHGVKIEAQFTVGEYKIVILSAKDSTGLDAWLRQEKYKIPEGAEPLLRPYVEAGMKFFVAKVDPAKVKFETVDGQQRAQLSPLRFHYDHDEFTLPIRLGLANSSGTQDLIVNILSPRKRFEVTNYKNVPIPTNLDVKNDVRDKFAEFYAALFDKTLERNPGAVVTEYAWDASTCDPCPGPNLGPGDFTTLGADVLKGPREKPQPYEGFDFVLTRLHARYGKNVTDDLRFKEARPVAGGREHLGKNGKLEEGWQEAPMNNFQARYAIRHAWAGDIKCDKPERGRWGGRNSDTPEPPKPAVKMSYVKRDAVVLTQVIAQDVPEIGLKAAARMPAPTAGGTADKSPPRDDISFGEPPAKPPARPSAGAQDRASGCGCKTSSSAALWPLLGAVAWLVVRRRPRPRKAR